MRRDYVLTTVLVFFLLGISLASTLIYFSIVVVLMVMSALVWIGFLWRQRSFVLYHRQIILLALLALLFGVTRFTLDYWIFPLQNMDLGSVQITGQVTALPERNGRDWNLQVKILDWHVWGDEQLYGEVREDGLFGKVVAVDLPVQMEIHYGDRLLLTGWLTGAGNEKIMVNFQQKLFRQKLWGILETAVLKKKLGNVTIDLWKLIFSWREFFSRFFSMTLAEPAASLVNGVLIGERSNIPEDLARAFQITGLTHILAISGFNITLIINLLIVATGAWPRGARVTLTLVLIVVFVIITGASASVVRAAVMGILFLLVKNLGRRVKAFKAILLSVAGIVLVEPRLLNFDISFQLSVLATLSLIFYSPFLEGAKAGGWKQLIWEGMAITLAAQVITLPFIFYHFGTISLISPLANLLIGPLIPLLMLMGVLVLFLGGWGGPLALMVIGLTQMLVSVMAIIILTLAKIPLAQVEFGQGLWWLVILYYGILFILSRKYKLVPDFF